MEIVLRNTDQIVRVNGVRARVWCGVTSDGTGIVAMIPAIGLALPHGAPDLEEIDVEHESLVITTEDGEEVRFG